MAITNLKIKGESIKQDSYNRLVTDAQIEEWNNKADVDDFPESLKNPNALIININNVEQSGGG